MKRATRWIGAGPLAAVLLALALYAANVIAGMHARAQTSGTISGFPLAANVRILRDARGIPHIRAANDLDLFFGEGYVEGQDRAFQLDLLRRFVYGRLAEVLGPSLLRTDEVAREVPVAQIVARQWAALDARDRALMRAFAAGVNAAFARESTPVEFRALMYKPQRWTPQDSLAVGFATVLDLTDSWNDVAARVGRAATLEDRCYDAPVMAGLAALSHSSPCVAGRAALLQSLATEHPAKGSNAWASGSAHTTTGRALLASDPHLRLQIPGIWYLVDMRSPTFHAAGATLAGTPGVILGHNDHIAWGATNGTTTALSVYDAPAHLYRRFWQTERFHVRFGATKSMRYYRAPHFFGLDVTVRGKRRFVLVRWPAYAKPRSAVATFMRLDEAKSMAQALAALRSYPGPTQNFVLADDTGRAAYQLAGAIPNDPLWARGIHPASALHTQYPNVAFAKLPHIAPSRTAIVWTANNKMYGAGYPYRLSAAFIPPYRAYRIATLLRARRRYDVRYFTKMQMDTYSPAEHEFAQLFPLLRAWNGRFSPGSTMATAVYDARLQLTTASRNVEGITIPPSPQPWRIAGAVVVRHPLAALGLTFLNGTTLPGDGDAFTIHRQNYGFSQSYRAVWDVGNWDAGGIVIPQGESGRPGSGHYTDEARAWTAGTLLSLPYSRAAVERAAVDRLVLEPARR